MYVHNIIYHVSKTCGGYRRFRPDPRRDHPQHNHHRVSIVAADRTGSSPVFHPIYTSMLARKKKKE